MAAIAAALTAGAAVGRAEEVVAPAEETETPIPIPPPLLPYNVRVLVAFDDYVGFPPEFRTRVLAELRDRCDGYWGRMCTVQIEEFSRLLPATSTTLERLPVGHETPETANCDKAFFLTVQADGGGSLVSGKCWDAAARTTSDVLTAAVFRRNDIADRLFGLLSELFEPVVEIVDFDHEHVSLQIRAGEIPPADPNQAQLKPGRLLTPFYRFLSREGEVLRIQEIPWTYLIVADVDRATANCKIVSGLRVPLTKRRRRLVEARAQGVRPRFDSTRLKFVSQQFADQPLFGLTVSIVPEQPATATGDEQPQEEKPGRVTMMTDRAGSVTIPSDGSNTPILLAVHSGKSLLARVPLIPGLAKETEVRLPDDTVRLNVEGHLAVLESQVIDAVARRAVLMARTRAAIKENDWKRVDEFLKRIDEITGPGPLRTELTIIRERGVSAAAARRDTSAQRRIERLCSRTGELIDNYLNLDKVRAFREEADELRKALDAK